MMRPAPFKVALLVVCAVLLAPAMMAYAQGDGRPSTSATLSPYWDANMQQLGDTIGALSQSYGFHPDFIAAVIYHESDSAAQSGALAFGPGLQLQQAADGAEIPQANFRWGMAVLSYVVQQSGGDLFTALAAYRGGWQQVSSPGPREFAARVLDSYARALAARSGLDPDAAAGWTVAVEIRAGNVPADATLVLGARPLTGVQKIAEHTVYAFAGSHGRAYNIRGYIVPVGWAEMTAAGQPAPDADRLEAPLRARLGEKAARKSSSSRVLLACLPSLDRLRGQVTTRWYGPADCPTAGR